MNAEKIKQKIKALTECPRGDLDCRTCFEPQLLLCKLLDLCAKLADDAYGRHVCDEMEKVWVQTKQQEQK